MEQVSSLPFSDFPIIRGVEDKWDVTHKTITVEGPVLRYLLLHLIIFLRL